jgi:hypothetical protein
MALGHSRPRAVLGVIRGESRKPVFADRTAFSFGHDLVRKRRKNQFSKNHVLVRIAPSSCSGARPEPTGLVPKRRPKPRVAKH